MQYVNRLTICLVNYITRIMQYQQKQYDKYREKPLYIADFLSDFAGRIVNFDYALRGRQTVPQMSVTAAKNA